VEARKHFSRALSRLHVFMPAVNFFAVAALWDAKPQAVDAPTACGLASHSAATRQNPYPQLERKFFKI
jgi:hypothetical protein